MHITNKHGCGRKSPHWFLIAAAAFNVIALSAPLHAQSLTASFKPLYHLNNIGIPTGLSSPSGAIAFPSGNPNVLYMGGNADSSSGAIYAIGVTRDGNNHITGFTGNLTTVASAPDIDGGLVTGPGGIEFYTTYPDNTLGEILPGSTSPNRIISLSGLGVVASTGGLGLVPPGFPDAGHLKITSFDRGAMYDTTLSSGTNGTDNISNVSSSVVYFGTSPDSAVFVPAGNPGFGSNIDLICNYTDGTVQAYDADSNANPMLSTEKDFITGLTSVAGAVIDPLTHDVLIEDQGTNGVLVISGFANAAISSLSPSNVAAGTSFTLTVNGSGFLPGASLMWNGTKLTTTVTGTTLTASVPASVNGLLSSYPGSATICVLNADGTQSNHISLAVSAPGITITGMVPNTVKANSGLTLTINGSNFMNGSVIYWNGTALPTNYYSSSDLTARVPQSLNVFSSSYPTTANITVSSPGSQNLATSSIAITEPIPVFNSFSPATVPAGQSSFSLNVYGNGYVNGAKVNWNGTQIPTFYISPTHLSADVSAAQVASPGSVLISITNATTGGTCGTRTLTVSPTTISLVQGISGRDSNTGVITVPLYILNTGNGSANSLQITSATIGTTTTTVPVPINLGNLAPSSLATTTLTFPGSAGSIGSSQPLKITGTYTGGTFTISTTITLP